MGAVHRARLALTLVSICSRAFGSCKLAFSSDDSTSDSTGTCSYTKMHTQYTKAPLHHTAVYAVLQICSIHIHYLMKAESTHEGKFSPLNALVTTASIMITLLIHVQLLCDLNTHCPWQQEEWPSAFLHCILPRVHTFE